MQEQVVTGTSAQASDDPSVGFDYDRLVDRFGCKRITQELLQEMEDLIGKKLHPFLTKGTFFSHRDLDLLLTKLKAGRKFYLYTGRGPSSDSMHLGHLLPFLFTKYLQDTFNVPLVIQITNDEKFLQTPSMTLEESSKITHENIKDIIACGFDINKTFIFTNTDYFQYLYPNILKIQKAVNVNQIKSIFGFTDLDNIGKISFPAIQAAPSFCNSFPHIFEKKKDVYCLIPCGIDQDPYFRMTRDVAPRLGYVKPALIHGKFLPSLKGVNKKMSSSDPESAIFLTDTPAQVETKIMEIAFSGAQPTSEVQAQHVGADLNVDIPFRYLSLFLDDKDLLDKIEKDYASGEMDSTQVKNILIDVLNDLLDKYRETRSKVTDEMVAQFMTPRKMQCLPFFLPSMLASTENNKQ